MIKSKLKGKNIVCKTKLRVKFTPRKSTPSPVKRSSVGTSDVMSATPSKRLKNNDDIIIIDDDIDTLSVTNEKDKNQENDEAIMIEDNDDDDNDLVNSFDKGDQNQERYEVSKSPVTTFIHSLIELDTPRNNFTAYVENEILYQDDAPITEKQSTPNDASIVKRRKGRPRLYPIVNSSEKVKRGRGRPRLCPIPTSKPIKTKESTNPEDVNNNSDLPSISPNVIQPPVSQLEVMKDQIDDEKKSGERPKINPIPILRPDHIEQPSENREDPNSLEANTNVVQISDEKSDKTEEVIEKRGRGRPRIKPILSPKEKRGRGRPRINPITEPNSQTSNNLIEVDSDHSDDSDQSRTSSNIIQKVETKIEKKGPGRPRIHPLPDTSSEMVKKGPGRPRKRAYQALEEDENPLETNTSEDADIDYGESLKKSDISSNMKQVQSITMESMDIPEKKSRLSPILTKNQTDEPANNVEEIINHSDIPKTDIIQLSGEAANTKEIEIEKRGRGRPRIKPIVSPKEKRGPGRPRINPISRLDHIEQPSENLSEELNNSETNTNVVEITDEITEKTEEVIEKRGRGRPRIKPILSPKEKRRRGRPRINPIPNTEPNHDSQTSNNLIIVESDHSDDSDQSRTSTNIIEKVETRIETKGPGRPRKRAYQALEEDENPLGRNTSEDAATDDGKSDIGSNMNQEQSIAMESMDDQYVSEKRSLSKSRMKRLWSEETSIISDKL